MWFGTCSLVYDLYLVVWYCVIEWLNRLKIGQKQGDSYGMELPRVGAFTDFRGSGYRNPVQILGVLAEKHENLGFWGLV